jgi:hypothetical protein
MMDNIVDYYSKELDDLIDRMYEFIKDLKAGRIDDYSDQQLEMDILEIPILMYRAGRELAKLGGESDMSRSKKLEIFNRALASAGTVQEKKSRAERLSMEHQIVEDVLKRAYDQLKMKIEKADSVYSALKKVYSKRMLELEVFRKELKGANFTSMNRSNDDDN